MIHALESEGSNLEARPNRPAPAHPRGLTQHAMRVLPFASCCASNAANHSDAAFSSSQVVGAVESSNKARAPQLPPNSIVGNVRLCFIDPKTMQLSVKPSTSSKTVLRHLHTKSNTFYHAARMDDDLHSIRSMEIFKDVSAKATQATGPNPKVDLTLELVEKKATSFGGGLALSSLPGGKGVIPGMLVGSLSYSNNNLFGWNHKLHTEVELGQKTKVSHTNPWLFGKEKKSACTVQVLHTRTSGNMIHGKFGGDVEEPTLASSSASGHVVLGKLATGVELLTPLSDNWLYGSTLSWQRTNTTDELKQPIRADVYGLPLTLSGGTSDTMVVTAISAAYSHPSEATKAHLSVEQALPLLKAWPQFTRLRMRLDKRVPVASTPFKLHLKARAGFVQGNLPPYEAFPIGGINYVRGYGEGDLASSRHSVDVTAELRFPLISIVSGALFADWGSDLRSGGSIKGDPAGVRQKPGRGHGYGGGLTLDTALGPLRLEYARNARNMGRFHIGVGYE